MTSEKVLSRNPRNGVEFQKWAAGDFIRGLYESIRRLNHDVFNDLQVKLHQSAVLRAPLHPEENDVCGILSKWIRKGLHFADLSVQMHYGSKILGDELFWHSDAENSLLHLGITVRGERILHTLRSKTINGHVEDILIPMTAGDVYVSSSTLMNHAPEYPDVNWDTRIVAIQSRFLYTNEELKNFRAKRNDESWKALTEILADSLSKLQLKLPSMRDVDIVMDEMEMEALPQ